MQHCSCLKAKGKTCVLSLWLWKAEGSIVCSVVEGAPYSRRAFMYSSNQRIRHAGEERRGKGDSKDWMTKWIQTLSHTSTESYSC